MLACTTISYTKLHYLVTYIYLLKVLPNGRYFEWLRSSEKTLKIEEILHVLENVTWYTKRIYNLDNIENKTTEKD